MSRDKKESNKETDKAFDEAFDKAFDERMKDINEQLEQDLLIGLVGEVNTGKSSTINQILEKEVANTNPKPGETVSVDPYNMEGLEKIKLMDTPGLNDPNDKNPKKTLEFIKNADVILFFTNAAGTVFSDSEKEKFHEIEKYNKDIMIVLNKIDAAEDIQSLVRFIAAHAGRQYHIIPISSRTGENIDQLKERILAILEKKGKDLLFAKSMKDKSTAAKRWIVSAGLSAGVVGASPIPGSDMIPLTALQVGLLVKLSRLYDKPLTKKAAKDLIIVTTTRTVGRSVFRQAVKLFPGYGSVAGGVIASSLTLALGFGVKQAYENDRAIDLDFIGDLFKNYKKRKDYRSDANFS